MHVRLVQSSQYFNSARALQLEQRHLCLIIDDSGSMSGAPITKVRDHCSRLGKKFFEASGKKITLIKFGSQADKQTFSNDQ